MSVWRRFHGHGFPSLVTTNVAERRPVFGEDGAARRFIEVMRSSATDEGAYLIAWAIMPEHVHFIVSLPATGSLGRLVQLIKGRFAREYNAAKGVTGSFWQKHYHERALRKQGHLITAIEYVLNNPVAAGLADTSQDYPWCSTGDLADWSG